MSCEHRTPHDAEYRTCTCCKKTYPNTEEYFGKNNGDGRNSVCKTCVSKKNKEKRELLKQRFASNEIEYGDEKICKKCGRSLPNSYKYFPVDKCCKTGLRNICRECDTKYGGFLSEDYEPNKLWTSEEDEIIITYYKDYTGKELQEKFFPDRTVRAIESRGSILGVSGKSDETYWRGRQSQAEIISNLMTGRTLSDESRQKMSETKKEYYKTHISWWLGKKRSEEQCRQISERMKGKWAGDNNPRHKNPLIGSENGRWKGGINSTYVELRSETKDWQSESMKFCNYRCVISGGEFNNIHHIVSFRDIVDEVFIITGIEIRKTVSDYPEEEFDVLRLKTHELHDYYGYGACIQKDIHKLYHDEYGYTKFDPYSFLDFIYRIDCGDYNDWFKDHHLCIDINYNYVEYLEYVLQKLQIA